MLELLADPNAWAALVTLTVLEIVLGIDNLVFISVLVSRLQEPAATRARQIGLALALNTMIAVSIGGVVPLLLKRVGQDPAVASGPLLRLHRGVYAVGHARLRREGHWLAAVLAVPRAAPSPPHRPAPPARPIGRRRTHPRTTNTRPSRRSRLTGRRSPTITCCAAKCVNGSSRR